MDIEKLAATPGSEMPDGLTLGEQLLFLTLRELYKNFRSGAVNRERGRREKQRIMVAYQTVAANEKLLNYHMLLRRRLERVVGSLHKCGCPTCQKVGRVFDGIDRNDQPEDAVKLQEWNDKLRELVKERSERSAELANTLDRIRWIIEADADYEEQIARIKEVLKK